MIGIVVQSEDGKFANLTNGRVEWCDKVSYATLFNNDIHALIDMRMAGSDRQFKVVPAEVDITLKA